MNEDGSLDAGAPVHFIRDHVTASLNHCSGLLSSADYEDFELIVGLSSVQATLLQVPTWIKPHTILGDAKVEMGTGRVTRRAGIADQLPSPD